jgi:predicted PurR-regulated permease PerM
MVVELVGKRPPWSTPPDASSVPTVVLTSALFLVAVIYGRDVLMPLSLAAVLAFALAPAVAWLAKHKIPRTGAVAIVLTILVGASLWGATIFSSQVLSLTASLSSYKDNLAHKARSLSPAASGGAIQRATESLSALYSEVEKQTRPHRDDEQIRVIVENEKDGGLRELLETARTALEPLEISLLTLVYVAVLLTEHYDLMDRMVRIAGVETMSRTTAAFATAGERLSAFFVRQSAINLVFGMATGLALGLLGIPNAVLWGMGAAFFRFIPFIGVFIAAVPPLLLAAAVAPGWSLLVAVLGLYLVLELVTANVIEPIVIGRHVGISPLAFVAAGTFWWVVWGPVGLLLASPLTTVFIVFGEFFPAAEFVTLLFGERPPLTPEHEYYHRLLAGDAESAANVIVKATNAQRRLAVIDEVVIPALRIGAKDLRDQRITAERGDELAESIREVADYASKARLVDDTSDIILVPGHGPLDAAAGELIASVLADETGVRARVLQSSTGTLALSSLKAEEKTEPEALILFSVGGLSAAQMQHMARRTHILFPEARIIVCHPEPARAGNDVDERTVLTLKVAQVAAHLQLLHRVDQG